jgi:hypothetical protein
MRWLLALVVAFACEAHAQRIEAGLHCKPAGTDFTYDCVIKLSRGGAPLSGAQITVGADMPSMPLAHNIKPVKAKPGNKPGEYHARLELEMDGEWAVKLRLSGPVRDQRILRYDFTGPGTARRK